MARLRISASSPRVKQYLAANRVAASLASLRSEGDVSPEPASPESIHSELAHLEQGGVNSRNSAEECKACGRWWEIGVSSPHCEFTVFD